MGSARNENEKLAMEAATPSLFSSFTEDAICSDTLSVSCVECAPGSVTSSSSTAVDLMNFHACCGLGTSSTPCDQAMHADMRTSVLSSPTHVRANLNPDFFASPYAFVPCAHGWASGKASSFTVAPLCPPSPLQSLDNSNMEMSRNAFLCSYVNTLIPALRRIHSQSFPASIDAKLSAFKLAADVSLAVSAGSSNLWSQALLHEVASSPACVSSSPKVGRSRMPVRKPLSGTCKRARRRSILRAISIAKGSNAGSIKFSHIVDCSPYRNSGSCARRGGDRVQSMKSRQSQVQQRVKPKRAVRRSGLSSYLKVLRSSRWKRSKASFPTVDEASAAAAAAISKEHIESLGGLVPGGHNMDVPLLLEEAADYILSLQMQVEALQSLSRLVSS